MNVDTKRANLFGKHAVVMKGQFRFLRQTFCEKSKLSADFSVHLILLF